MKRLYNPQERIGINAVEQILAAKRTREVCSSNRGLCSDYVASIPCRRSRSAWLQELANGLVLRGIPKKVLKSTGPDRARLVS